MEAYRSRGLDRAEAYTLSDEISGDDGSNRDATSGESARTLQIVMPLEHFHGPTFHTLLHDYRETNGRGLDEEGEMGEEGGIYVEDDEEGGWIGWTMM